MIQCIIFRIKIFRYKLSDDNGLVLEQIEDRKPRTLFEERKREAIFNEVKELIFQHKLDEFIRDYIPNEIIGWSKVLSQRFDVVIEENNWEEFIAWVEENYPEEENTIY